MSSFRPCGRLAPSPTGYLHLGNAWSFLHAFLSIRAACGRLVLRMEDIDPQRSSSRFANAIMEDLAWLGIQWDEGPYFQSRRLSLYTNALERLARDGHLYPCYCTRKELRTLAGAPHPGEYGIPYPGTCRNLTRQQRALLERGGRSPCFRVRYPEKIVVVRDKLMSAPGVPTPSGVFLPDGCNADAQGNFLFTPRTAGGDFAVRRSDGVIAYTLAVVVDDAAMGVNEVVRGCDILAATPRQIVLHHMLEKPVPAYMHVPLVMDAAGERLAKRHESLTVRALRENGVRPQAIIGYLAWKAGLVDAPCARNLSELVANYAVERLTRDPVILPENVATLLRALY